MNEKVKVLLLDDMEDAIVLQTLILESNGYEVVSAINGINGLEKLKNYHPDIIISDVLMPKMDGFEFCRKVKEQEDLKNIPFVFYSAQYTDKYDQKLADEIGAEGFIIKPIEMEDFLEKINQILQKHKISSTEENTDLKHESEEFDKKHYIAQSKMLDKKLKELEEQHLEIIKSEEKYRRLLDGLSSDYFIYHHDIEGIFTYISPSVSKLLGYSTEDIKKHYSIYFTDNPINQLAKDNTNKALQGEEQQSYEVEVVAKNGKFHLLQISERPLFDEDENVIGIEGIAHDITAQKRLEKLEHESNDKIHKSLVDAIGAIAITVEKRDPYTAGHQQRVAKLAVMIGRKLGLSNEKLEGILLGATVHDIGKITIPTEILTKPTKLMDIEFELIKNHPQQGYEILKDVEFPWPLGKMILQHHERIDGSGYPNGLKADEIIIEAKIICVADVIEAISSHRPYRAALGLELALEEVKKYRNILYDASVVDAAIEVMNENPTLLEERSLLL